MSQGSITRAGLIMATLLVQPEPESRRILSNLLSKLRLPDSPYKKFTQIVNQIQQLEELMYRFVRLDILALIDSRKLESIKSRKNNDNGYDGRAIYLHVIENHSVLRFYVGQAWKLCNRIKVHNSFRSWCEKPSLHYYALQRSLDDYYVTLSYVPDTNSCRLLGIKHPGRLLDLLETWCCLMFHTLPEKYLEEFIPKDIQIVDTRYGHLNLKLPLQGAGTPEFPEMRDILFESRDPLFQDFYFEQASKHHCRNKELIAHREQGLEVCKRLDRVKEFMKTWFCGRQSATKIFTRDESCDWAGRGTTNFNKAERRHQSEAFRQSLPRTPPPTRFKAISNMSIDIVSLDSRTICLKSTIIGTSEKGTQKRKHSEETPCNLPRSRPAKSICIDGDSVPDSIAPTAQPINRILDFRSDLNPEKAATEAIQDEFCDLTNHLDGDWGSDYKIS